MTETLNDLCSIIIEDLYGSFLAEIFQHLTRLGRLSAQQIAQKCHGNLRQIKSGLSSLIQLRLIYHHTSPEGGSTYQANTQTAYELLRKGKLIEQARFKHGKFAAKVVEELSVLGSATFTELGARVGKTYENGLSNHATSRSSESHYHDYDGFEEELQDFQNVIRRLLKDGFLQTANLAHFQTVYDARHDASIRLRGSGMSSLPKTKKQREDLEEKIEDEVRKGYNRPPLDIAQSSVNGNKISALDDPFGKYVNETKQATMLFLSFKPVKSSLRNEILVNQARNTFGEMSAKVTAATFRQIGLDSNVYQKGSEIPSRQPFQALDIAVLQSDLNESQPPGTAESANLTNGWHHKHLSDEATLGQQNGHLLHASSNLGRGEILRHLGVLAESQFRFLFQGDTPDSWLVNRVLLAKLLREEEIMRIMGERLGSPGLRVVRMLIDRGKLDENALQELGLLGAKELRQNLAQLHTMGFLELQEVPREPQRQPNRTIFLWFFDAVRVQRGLLTEIYKAMTHIFQRLRVERARLESTLGKIERSDVKGNEEEILSQEELTVLQQWRRKEEWLLGEISRLDESVILLRDL